MLGLFIQKPRALARFVEVFSLSVLAYKNSNPDEVFMRCGFPFALSYVLLYNPSGAVAGPEALRFRFQ